MLSEVMSEHDRALIEDWKDDLGNLLVFVCGSMIFHFTSNFPSVGWPVLRCRDWLCYRVIWVAPAR